MLQVVNRTPFSATLAVFANPAGIECAYGAVKATFDFSTGVPQLAPRQASLLATDVYWGDPAQSSLRAAGDITLSKPATDVLLTGRAVAAAPVESMPVRVSVGPVAKVLQVFGSRRWVRRGKDDWAYTDPEPFERMPLRWELAFGGTGAVVEGHEPEHEARNPVGAGFVASYEKAIDGRALPNIEDPAQLIATPADRPAPAGCAPVAPVWLARRAYAGTYDEAWQGKRAPFLPLDFDSRFFNVAAPGLVAPGYLAGGEAVDIEGCSLDPIRFTLPALHLDAKWDFDGREIDAAPVLDTVLIEPDYARLQMVWRCELAVDKKTLKMRQFTIACPEYAVQRKAA